MGWLYELVGKIIEVYWIHILICDVKVISKEQIR